ncbi:MAG TPA: DUF2239 family protein [Pseudomonadota bacterium]|nr:DUF2239 family protein [Pseudomonadota bacterium]
MDEPQTYSVFAGERLLLAGPLTEVLRGTKQYIDECERQGADPSVLIFEDETGRQVDFDFRGTVEQVLAHAVRAPRVGPGRPRLGVVGREVSLLPRHWDWLEGQPGGASAALRRLVDEARKRNPAQQRVRQAIDATYRFMTALAGDRPGYEEATRALYAGDRERLASLITAWPPDVVRHIERLGRDYFAASAPDSSGAQREGESAPEAKAKAQAQAQE